MRNCRDICKSCEYKIRCGGCSVCEVLLCKSNCNFCSVICFKKTGISEYIDSFGGLNIKINKNNFIYEKLPTNIPVIQERIGSLIKEKDLDYVVVNAGNILSTNGESVRKKYKDIDIVKSMNLKNGTKTILEFYIKDRFLEGFWDQRFDHYKNLKKLKFNYIITPNFSVYDDLPRIDHLYNIKRSSIIYNELIDNNINAIPDIGWFNARDLEIWIEEINRNDIKLISFSFQNVGVALKPSNIWKQNLLGLRYLCSNIKTDVDILIVGVASPFRILEIYKSIEKSNRLIILNQTAFIHSRKGMLSEYREVNSSMTFDEIFSKNISYYNNIYDNAYDSEDILNISRLSKKDLINFHKKYSEKSDSKESDYIYRFLRRCLKKKHVKEESLSQNQEEVL
ncbi:MAG: DUF4417 domain-containing protein [Clostridiales bacterium]